MPLAPSSKHGQQKRRQQEKITGSGIAEILSIILSTKSLSTVAQLVLSVISFLKQRMINVVKEVNQEGETGIDKRSVECGTQQTIQQNHVLGNSCAYVVGLLGPPTVRKEPSVISSFLFIFNQSKLTVLLTKSITGIGVSELSVTLLSISFFHPVAP